MTMHNFIKENRKEIDQCITRACPNIGRLNDNDRKDWILNDEGLYLWAKNKGVKLD